MISVYLFEKGLRDHSFVGWLEVGQDFPQWWLTERERGEGAGCLYSLWYSAPNCHWVVLIHGRALVLPEQRRCGFLPNGKLWGFLLCRKLQNLGRFSPNGNLKWVLSHWKLWLIGDIAFCPAAVPKSSRRWKPWHAPRESRLWLQQMEFAWGLIHREVFETKILSRLWEVQLFQLWGCWVCPVGNADDPFLHPNTLLQGVYFKWYCFKCMKFLWEDKDPSPVSLVGKKRQTKLWRTGEGSLREGGMSYQC